MNTYGGGVFTGLRRRVRSVRCAGGRLDGSAAAMSMTVVLFGRSGPRESGLAKKFLWSTLLISVIKSST